MSSYQCVLAKVIDAGLLEDGALLMYRVRHVASMRNSYCKCRTARPLGRNHMQHDDEPNVRVPQPKGGELKAVGKARRDGVEVAGQSKLMTFGAFEAYAKSALRRATGNMYTIKGRVLQARK